ncbi:MAG TPA: DUF4129 domain-containing protein, partial [Anaerolineales bacterium]|nr:DUF4129 domain-containing protein [Anaerolineales bacterium]
WLKLAWQWLYTTADRAGGSLVQAVGEGWRKVVTRLEGNRVFPRLGLISLGSLDARRRIYFFYLTMVRRGGEQGIPRNPSQTPAEYAVTLEEALPSQAEDIDSMTKSFVEARYSRREVNVSDADRTRSAWVRIRRALKEKSKKNK